MNKKSTVKIGLIIFLMNLFLSSCCPFIKADSLGHNFILSEYDNVDRRILYSKDKCSGEGIEIVPMTVLEYANNSNWIIAKSSKSKLSADFEYWIIDKNFDIQQNDSAINIIKAHVYGPLDSISFINKLNQQNINLKLKKILVDK